MIYVRVAGGACLADERRGDITFFLCFLSVNVVVLFFFLASQRFYYLHTCHDYVEYRIRTIISIFFG